MGNFFRGASAFGGSIALFRGSYRDFFGPIKRARQSLPVRAGGHSNHPIVTTIGMNTTTSTKLTVGRASSTCQNC